MVWGGISLTGRTDLVTVNGNLNSERYITDILEAHVVPYAPYIGPNFLLMHDNARSHTSLIVRNYPKEVGIDHIDWPARSPDLNPIEHVWDFIGRRLRSEGRQPQNLQELEERLVELWNGLDQNLIRTLVLSMNQRCREVIRGRGGNTRY